MKNEKKQDIKIMSDEATKYRKTLTDSFYEWCSGFNEIHKCKPNKETIAQWWINNIG